MNTEIVKSAVNDRTDAGFSLRARRIFSQYLSANSGTLSLIVGLILVLAYFLAQSWDGLFIYFQHDDIMNLHHGWAQPMRKLLWAIVFPFTSVLRPFGNALYRLEFALFGWDPFPYRVITYVFLAANILLVCWLGKLLSGFREIGLLAALLFAFHPRTDNLYINNGTVYDALGGFFFLLGLCVYIWARQVKGRVRGWPMAGVIGAVILGVNSKEFLVSLPVILIIWEIVNFGWRSRNSRAGWLGLIRHLALPLLLCPVMALSIQVKRQAVAGHPLYTPEYSVRRVTQNLRQETSELLGYKGRELNLAKTALVHAVILAAALAFRRRYLIFVFAYVLLTPIAVILIPWRGLFAFYINLAGWAIAGASILVFGRDWLLAHVWRRPIPSQHLWEYERVALFGAIIILLFNYASIRPAHMREVQSGNLEIRGDLQDYQRLKLQVPRGGSILLLDDRCETDNWTPHFVARLFFKDRNLIVDRVKMKQQQPGRQYDIVLDMVDGRLAVVQDRTQKK